MKVEFENGVSSYSGRYKEIVYQAWFEGQLCYARRNFYPTLGSPHETMKRIAENLNQLFLDAASGYRQDLATYAKKNYTQNRGRTKAKLHKMPSSKALFIRCLWLWYKTDPEHIDLATLTLSDITTMHAPLISVAGCVTAGYLKSVTGYELLTRSIV